MLTELLMQDERRAGREEGRKEGRAEGIIEGYKESILDILSELGPVQDKTKEKIMRENHLDTLKGWMKLAAKANSVEQFIESI